MFCKIKSAAIHGVEMKEINVEVDISDGLPSFDMVGLLNSEVKEAKEKSGSFITIDHALSQGKTVYALPGRVTDPLSIGCNRLILEGAIPLINSKQIVDELMPDSFIKNKKNNIFLEKEYEVVYSCLDLQPTSAEKLAKRLNISIPEIYEKLLYLEMNGLILESSKGQFIKKF